MSNEKALGFAISTVESRLLENVGFLAQLTIIKDPVVIVNQYQKLPLEAPKLGNNVQVINSKGRGLSRSRNIGLTAIGTDFVMICDDDISLVLENITRLKSGIQETPETAMFFTRLQKTSGELWRQD